MQLDPLNQKEPYPYSIGEDFKWSFAIIGFWLIPIALIGAILYLLLT